MPAALDTSKLDDIIDDVCRKYARLLVVMKPNPTHQAMITKFADNMKRAAVGKINSYHLYMANPMSNFLQKAMAEDVSRCIDTFLTTHLSTPVKEMLSDHEARDSIGSGALILDAVTYICVMYTLLI
jgi:hypothetical protein